MITLIIDTSTEKSLVAFARPPNLLLKFFLPSGFQSSSTLMGAIKKGLEELQITAASLEAVAVGVGPGSYTGIRIGAAAAYGIAAPRSLPLIGFCSLEGFISESDGPFASIIQSRIGGAYVLLQEREKEKFYQRSLAQFIASEKLEEYLADYPTRVGPHVGYPDAEYLVRLVEKKLEMREYSSELKLMYLRTPQYAINTHGFTA